MSIWGRRKREAEEALSSAKRLIIKVKKKGIDTSEAEKLYKEAKKAIKNRRYSDAKEKIEEAKKIAKKEYTKGIKKRLKSRISKLSKKIDEMQIKNLSTKRVSKFLKEAEVSFEGGIKEFKRGLKAAREGLRRAEDRLEKFNRVSGLLVSIGTLLRRMKEQRSDLSVLNLHKEGLSTLEEMISKGKIQTTLKEAEKLYEGVKTTSDRFFKAYESTKALEKVIKDGEVLEANIDGLSKLKDAETLLMGGEFERACKIADKSKEKISFVLKKHRDAKYHVDMAEEKIIEVRNWGFSAFEAERALNLAKDALRNREFGKACALSEESKEKASNIRERHKRSLERIRLAKEEVEKIKAKGVDISGIKEIISEAENEFYKGDYSASEEKIDRVFEAVKESS
ncbi:MAG: hypothetical protein V3U20_11260 [Thermoplasmata archaeon]